MQPFYVTFGVGLRVSPHPLEWPKADGYLTVLAQSETIARNVVMDVVGEYAGIYETLPPSERFPLGELAILTAPILKVHEEVSEQ